MEKKAKKVKEPRANEHAHDSHDHSQTSDKARSQARSGTERDDKTYYGTVRENSDIGAEESWSTNMKRMYDEFQDLSLVSARHQQQHFDTLVSHAQQHFDGQQTLLAHLMAGIVDTANLTNKQAVAHRDLAIHHEFGAHEQVDDPRDKK